MSDKSNKECYWCNRPTLSEDDHHELETMAAINEFDKKMPRPVAEEVAYHNYMRNKHIEASAHHLLGMKAAHAASKMDEARKHGKMYESHMKAAGLNHVGPVPEEVKAKAKETTSKVYKFKGHAADVFAESHEQPSPVSKSLVDRLTDIYYAAKGILELRKGDVLSFKPRSSSTPSAPTSSTPASSSSASVTSLAPKIKESEGRKAVMDRAKTRIDAGEPEFYGKPMKTNQGGPSKYDYSHFLPSEDRFKGMSLHVEHYKDHDAKGSDKIIGIISQNGNPVASMRSDPSFSRKPKRMWITGAEQHANTMSARSLSAAVNAHHDWAGFHRASEHTKGIRDLYHDEKD